MFVLFTDIDGTITNKYTHAFEGSDVWLKKLNKLGIAVIFASSKTFLEICNIQEQLNINQPFIFENGSAIALPKNQLNYTDTGSEGEIYHDFVIHSLVPKNLDIQLWNDEINKLYPGNFFSLQSGSRVQLMQITGLTEELLKLAQQRMFTQTYFFSDQKISLKSINDKLTRLNAVAVQGSRFITVSHKLASKGNAIRYYLNSLQDDKLDIRSYSVGDGKNDYSMFGETNFSYFLTDNISVTLKTPNTYIINPEGPLGFIKVCKKIIEEFESRK